MKILKFGGSSVKTPDRIRKVVQIIKADNKARAVICSAFGGITDLLIETANTASSGKEEWIQSFTEIERIHVEAARDLVDVRRQSGVLARVKNKLNNLQDTLQGVFLLGELSKRTLDHISGFGERLSCYIIAEACKDYGLEAEYCDARDLLVTNSNFGEAQVLYQKTNPKIRKHLFENSALQVITGFVSRSEDGIPTTLGRGGSDFTASIIAAAADAEELEIWTDVDGVMTADPRKVAEAFSIPSLTYEEAMELSHFGAKVIYPPTMIPVMQRNIPIRIRNTFNPSFRGSLVSSRSSEGFTKAVKGITSVPNVALVRVQGSGMVGMIGVSGRLFSALARESINIILITQGSSEHSICFAVKPEEAEKAKQTVENEFVLELERDVLDKVVVEYNLSVVAVVGENMRRTAGIAGKIFLAFGKNGINVSAIAQGSSELNVSVIIRRDDEAKALKALHQGFFLSEVRTLNLFVVGTGLIGGTLLKQLYEQTDYLLETYNLEIKVVGITNAEKRVFDKSGIDLANWQKALDESDYPSDLDAFIREMNGMNMLNSVFADNTASSAVASKYEEILRNSISIVTPNKKASSGDYTNYTLLKNTAKRHNVMFLYETNVGAALPVIGTLRDLVASGDRILKIEAILSGTLSYLFNTFNGKQPYSKVVRKAKELGFTEPDPREDLRGTDVARKILILSRESGFKLELADIKVEGFLPQACLDAESVDDFFVELEKADADFEAKRAEAEADGKVFRYIAKMENGQATVSLQAVDSRHPFYNLSGSDNIIAFTTARYVERPLVIKGSGAGAEVTAAGVFADVIRVANYL